MAVLVSIKKMVHRFDLGRSADQQQRILRCLESTTAQLEAYLRTSFTRRTVTDLFWVDSDEQPFVGPHVELLLRQGFLVADTAEIRLSTIKDDLGDQDPLTDSVTLVNQGAGVVTLLGPQPNDIRIPSLNPTNSMFAQVTYTAGLETELYTNSTEFDAVDDPVYIEHELYTNVPAWLSELALISAFALFEGEVGCGDSDEKASPYSSKATSLAARYIRYFPAALDPMNYEQYY